MALKKSCVFLNDNTDLQLKAWKQKFSSENRFNVKCEAGDSVSNPERCLSHVMHTDAQTIHESRVIDKSVTYTYKLRQNLLLHSAPQWARQRVHKHPKLRGKPKRHPSFLILTWQITNCGMNVDLLHWGDKFFCISWAFLCRSVWVFMSDVMA